MQEIKSHDSLVIADAVRNMLNHNLFLPAFQGEFVWPPGNVEALFDSLMLGYPIGTFLLWRIDPSTRRQWEAYRFVEKARQHTTADSCSTAGVSPLYFVLDGQQRLSSLLIGLRGSYLVKKKHKKSASPDAWEERHLYLNLFKEPSGFGRAPKDSGARVSEKLRELFMQDCAGDCSTARINECLRAFETLDIDKELARCYPYWRPDGEYWNHMPDDVIDALNEAAYGKEAITRRKWFGFRLMTSPPSHGPHWHWYPVSQILDFERREDFVAFKRTERRRIEEYASPYRVGTFDRNLTALYETVWQKPSLWCQVESRQEHERVVDIFIRANERGVELTKSEVLLSLVTARWGDQAKDDIAAHVDYLNRGLTRKNDFDADFAMKCCLVLTDLPVEHKLDNFTNQNLDKIKESWAAIKDAMVRGVSLVNSFGIDRANLTSVNALIPVIYYLHRHPGVSLLKSSASDAQNASRVQRWLMFVLLNRVFGGHSDSVLRSMRKALADSAQRPDFPDKQLKSELIRMGKISSRGGLELARFSYGTRDAFLALTLLYDNHDWGETDYAIDHIYPQDIINKRVLKEREMSVEDQEKYTQLLHRIGNLELLLPGENAAKKATPPETWLRTRNHKFRSKHHYPPSVHKVDLDHFVEFVTEREKTILRRLTKILLPFAGER